ncbi:uncharacterized protein RSE6_04617 [Rhynchosporium secalis]|uniref:Uncharacterized protein n=1 Tax=Rhynchosporium secalis TaxID=38038 RepID=A0A1E1M5R5_RHYSE|nr:uncharacterized protein RSE6_04617 [Rhynchosporium secalis]
MVAGTSQSLWKTHSSVTKILNVESRTTDQSRSAYKLFHTLQHPEEEPSWSATAIIETKPADMYWSPTTIFSQDPASPANIFNDLILMASTQSTIIITKNVTFTSRDKHEFPGMLFGHPGRACFRRPISLGSPEKPKYGRPRKAFASRVLILESLILAALVWMIPS